MMDMKVQPGIMDIAPYVGGESDIDGAEKIIKLSSNEGALGPSPEASETYAALQRELHRYPDGECTALRHAIGGALIEYNTSVSPRLGPCHLLPRVGPSVGTSASN